MPVDVTHEQPTETIPLRTERGAAQPTFRVIVTGGPDAGGAIDVNGSGPARLAVGTGPTSDLRLTDRGVSRRHLTFALRDGALALADLGSTNGTFVGALQVRDASLTGGEEVLLGSTRLRIERLTGDASVTVARVASFGRVVGASVAMRRLYPTLARVANLDVPVLIEGDAGTGKELVAEAIHEEGARRGGELVVVDPEGTDPEAVTPRLVQAISEARGGTLVIDEPANLPAAAQIELARLLAADPRPTGGPRVIALSRTDVERQVQLGHLREELAERLSLARVELPVLRDRAGDITLLATTFFRALKLEDRFLAPLTLRRFEAYSWPGNVRELKTAILRYAATGSDRIDPRAAFRQEGEEASAEDLYRRVLEAGLTLTHAREIIIEDFDRRFVRRALERHNGNVTHAAAASGLARRYFQVLKNKRGV